MTLVDVFAKEQTGFDLRYISLGAGVQSSCLLLMSLEGAKMGRGLPDEEYVEAGVLPPVDAAIFADTQSEPKECYEWLEHLKILCDGYIPIHTPTEGSLRDAIVRATEPNSPRFASVPFWVMGVDDREAPGRRQCTREYKIDVVKREVRSILGIAPGKRAQGKFQVECWVGISVDEATRAKPSRYPWIENRWPLLYDIPMRRNECISWMNSHEYGQPAKSACTFCPYRTLEDWRRLRIESPEAFEDACEVDEVIRRNGPLNSGGNTMDKLQYVHRSLRPLREVVDDESLEEKNLNLFENECEGMCGV